MPEQPYAFNPKNLKEVIYQVNQIMDDLYNERLGGATAGDVFHVDNASDALTLNLAKSPGLTKNPSSRETNALAVLPDPSGPISLSSAGIDVALVTASKKGAAPKLPGTDSEYLDGTGAWSNPTLSTWPIGAVFITVLTDDPAITLGLGAWSLIGSGKLSFLPATITSEYGEITKLDDPSGTKVYVWQRTA